MADTWEQMSTWDLVLPPSRPSSWHLTTFREALRTRDRREPVAVLGSTPEFRDLLHECGFERIFVFDRNLEFYQCMSRLRVHRQWEQFVFGNWMETLAKFSGRFGTIMSDLTSGNVAYEEREVFYELITNALRPGGLFCDKVLTHPGDLLRVDDLVAKYSLLPLNLLTVNHFSCEMLFCSELLDDDYILDSTRFYAIGVCT